MSTQSLDTRFSLYAKRLEGAIAKELNAEVDIVRSTEPFGLLNVLVVDTTNARKVASYLSTHAPSLKLVKTIEYPKIDAEETDSILLVLGLKEGSL